MNSPQPTLPEKASRLELRRQQHDYLTSQNVTGLLNGLQIQSHEQRMMLTAEKKKSSKIVSFSPNQVANDSMSDFQPNNSVVVNPHMSLAEHSLDITSQNQELKKRRKLMPLKSNLTVDHEATQVTNSVQKPKDKKDDSSP